MDFKELYRAVEAHRYYIFSYQDLLSFFPGETRENLKTMLHRWARKGWVSPLKKGLYELTYPKDFGLPDLFVANKLYGPSYVSLETALSHYSIIPEVAMSVTSITTKPTRRFRNTHGLFLYRSVQPCAFTGYSVERQNGFEVLIAEPEKALVDYLYFRRYRGGGANLKEERVSRTAVSKLNRKKMERYAKIYRLTMKEYHAYL